MKVVHYMEFGMTACLVNGPPDTWPSNHKWTGEWKDVNCPACLAGKETVLTYSIGDDGKSITCLRCKLTSHNPNDVEGHFCAKCRVFHDDLWPPARKAWLEQDDPLVGEMRQLLANAMDARPETKLLLEMAIECQLGKPMDLTKLKPLK